jgi:hypothetical protein
MPSRLFGDVFFPVIYIDFLEKQLTIGQAAARYGLLENAINRASPLRGVDLEWIESRCGSSRAFLL